MANKTLFSSVKCSTVKNTNVAPVADTVNAAGGKAYKFTAKHTLAQIAATNCFNSTYYVDAETNLQLAKDAVKELRHDPEFIAKVAVYSRDKAYMKDMPAYLVAALAALDTKLMRKIFPKVIDNGKMLRNFMQIGRSGAAGKVLNMSSGAIRNAIQQWFDSKTPEFIFRASIGNDPTMRDMLRMARPKPENAEKAALFAYLKGAELDKKTGEYLTYNKDGSVLYRHSFDALPKVVKDYERFKASHEGEIPNVDFRMLDSILNKEEAKRLWASQARNAGWTMTRMNLNNFAKYGVFEDRELVNIVASRLVDREQIKKARAYPYQLLMAYIATEGNIPFEIREAQQDAMEIATENVPSFTVVENGREAVPAKVRLLIDTSGSMSSAVTGSRGTVTSKVRCIDVAGLFAAALLRNNKSSLVLPFDTSVHACNLNPRDTVITNAQALARFGGGGTDCSCALRHLNQMNDRGDAVIFISDNESWVDNNRSSWYFSRGTGLMEEWNIYKKRNPHAKLICIDLTPRSNSQASQHKDILQVGGFSDQVFDVVDSFIKYGSSNDHWVEEIERIVL